MDDNREEHSIMTLRKRIREEVPRRDRNPTLILGSDQSAMGGSRDGGGDRAEWPAAARSG